MPTPGPTSPRLFDRSARAAFLVAALVLAICAVGFRSAVGYLNVYLRKEPVRLRQPLTSIPRVLGDWEAPGKDGALEAAEVEQLGTDVYLNRVYRRRADGGDQVVALHVAYYTGMIDAVPHIPDRCLVGAGWEPVVAPADHALPVEFPGATPDPERVNLDSKQPYMNLDVVHPVTGARSAARLPFGAMDLRAAGFARPEAPDRPHWAGYFFIANHHATTSTTYIRTLAFRPSQKYAYYVKIQLEMTGTPDGGPDPFVETAGDLAGRLLPHLMLCLPDWSEVESGTVAPEP